MAALGAALFAGSRSNAQLPVSQTEGILAVPLQPSAVIHLGLPFTRTPVARVVITLASGLNVTVAGSPFTAGALVAAPHSAVIVGGPNDGLSFKITANTANMLTLDTAVPTGITANADEVLVLPDWTLGTVFGSANAQVSQLLLTGTAPASADKVSIEEAGVVTDYYFNSGSGWRRADGSSPSVDQAGVRIGDQKGVVITRIAGGPSNDLVLTGKVRSGTQRIVTKPGKTVIASNPFTNTLTLDSSGLKLAIRASASSTGADTVAVETAGVSSKYYLSNTGWRKVSDNTLAGGVQIEPGKSVKIERAGATPVYPTGWAPGRPKRYFTPVTPAPSLTWKVLQPFAS